MVHEIQVLKLFSFQVRCWEKQGISSIFKTWERSSVLTDYLHVIGLTKRSPLTIREITYILCWDFSTSQLLFICLEAVMSVSNSHMVQKLIKTMVSKQHVFQISLIISVFQCGKVDVAQRTMERFCSSSRHMNSNWIWIRLDIGQSETNSRHL